MPMNLVHPMCKIHAAKRLHLLDNLFAKANGAGWNPPSTFPLFSFRKNAGRATCPGNICAGIVWFLALPESPPLHKCLRWVYAIRAWGTPPCLHAVSWQQCNRAATTSISLSLICGSGTDTGCSRRSMHVRRTSCKQLHKTDVICNVPLDLSMSKFPPAPGRAGFWSHGQWTGKRVLLSWKSGFKPGS